MAAIRLGQRGGSVSESTVLQRTLTVADLQAWPRGRLLVLSAGNRPTIARSVPWMEKALRGGDPGVTGEVLTHPRGPR